MTTISRAVAVVADRTAYDVRYIYGPLSEWLWSYHMHERFCASEATALWRSTKFGYWLKITRMAVRCT